MVFFKLGVNLVVGFSVIGFEVGFVDLGDLDCVFCLVCFCIFLSVKVCCILRVVMMGFLSWRCCFRVGFFWRIFVCFVICSV